MCKLDVIFQASRGQDDPTPATHVVIIAVPAYAAVFDEENLTSAAASYDRLAEFWKQAGERVAATAAFRPTPAVASVRGAQLTVNDDSRARALFAAVLAFLRDLGPNDTLIVHWIGHGSFLTKLNDHLLYLPNLQSPDDMETLEGVWLTRLTNWVGANCRAGKQLFLMDCCSTEPSPHQTLPEQFPRFIERPLRGPKQIIIIGSGVGRAARGRDQEPSVFTNSVIAALTHYAASSNGVVSTGRQFVTALAAIAKAEWLTRRFPDFPRRVLARDSFDWTQEFVQEVQPFCRHYAAQQDLAIAIVADPRVHCCLTFRDDGRRLRSPVVETDCGMKLDVHRSIDEDDTTTAIWTWIGDASPGRQVRARLFDDLKNLIGTVECTAVRPVVSESF